MNAREVENAMVRALERIGATAIERRERAGKACLRCRLDGCAHVVNLPRRARGRSLQNALGQVRQLARPAADDERHPR